MLAIVVCVNEFRIRFSSSPESAVPLWIAVPKGEGI
jgi:hypothetical protein